MRDQDFFWDGVDGGTLLLQKCSDCGQLRYPPGPMCPYCHSLDWAPQQSSGHGIVCAWIVSNHPTEATAAGRIVALIQLDEGVRMIANLQNIDPGHMDIGLAVELFFADVDGVRLPQFRPSPAH